MKICLNGILVVEGKEDASYLSNYISSEIVITNGFDIPNSLVSHLKGKRAIILTDPDEAGKQIRDKINALLTNPINVEININCCNRNSKNGVAECDIDEILTKLKPYVSANNMSESDIKISNLYKLGLMGNKELREKVCKTLKLGHCNVKTLYRRLLDNNIKLDELCEIIKKYHGN